MIVLYFLVLVLILVSFIRTLNYFFQHYRTYRSLRNIPGPEFLLPFWGNLGLFVNLLRHHEPSKEFLDMLTRLSSKYDPDGKNGFFRLWLGPFMPIVVITNAGIAQKLLNSKDHLDKATFYGLFRFAIFDGIFTCKTELWRIHKRELQEHLKAKALRTYIENTLNELAILNEKIEINIRQNNGLIEDIKPLISTFVLDVLGRNLFTTEFFSQKTGEPEFVRGVHKLLEYSYIAFLRPYTYFFTNPLMKYLVSIPTIRKTLSLIIIFRKSVKKIIINRYRNIYKEKICTEKNEERKRITMLDAMIRVRMEQNHNQRINGMKEIEAQMNTFVIAGHDTTTSSLSWTIYLLAHHPEQQRKATEEVDEYLNHLELTEQPVTLLNLRRLKYLECCINESLRLYPSGPFIGRRSRSELQLENGFILPAKINYIIFIQHMHQNEKYFHKPECFLPERFQQSKDDDGRIWSTNSAFIPFASGLRMCLGKDYGIMQQKMFLVNLLSRYRIEPMDNYGDCKPKFNFLLSPGHFPVRFVSRQHSTVLLTTTDELTSSQQQLQQHRSL